ncbi:sterol desaturase family protein [Brevundimonas sp.]|uniref:sterol desaturase family protein n=1 Tax=Brevundimonas sp. TaxID=1871086 RepID=UPI00262B6ABF|nr:sterol desaturase family protein [Brevundimonas sp.]
MGDLLLEMNRWQVVLVLCAFVLTAGLEQLFPLRGLKQGRWTRWAANLVLFALGIGLFAAASPLLLDFALRVQGLLPIPPLATMGLPAWALILVSFLLIDFIGYLGHLLAHMTPWLWRLHRTHHSDEIVDGSTTVRHHPLETLVLGAFQLTLFVLLGLPLLVVVAYAVIVGVWQFFHHIDVRLPEAIDRPLRWVLVTPGLHRMHHSVEMREGNSNFGVVFSIWDRLFGTYRLRPEQERIHMPVGVGGFPAGAGVLGPLVEPLRR